MEYQSPEDQDFIVDDGYKHDKDPDYVPEEEESSFDEDPDYVPEEEESSSDDVKGKDFQELIEKVKKLGAESVEEILLKNDLKK